jgi:hypothetical protein
MARGADGSHSREAPRARDARMFQTFIATRRRYLKQELASHRNSRQSVLLRSGETPC